MDPRFLPSFPPEQQQLNPYYLEQSPYQQQQLQLQHHPHQQQQPYHQSQPQPQPQPQPQQQSQQIPFMVAAHGSLPLSAPPSMSSLSSGQGYYTLESLEGSTAMAPQTHFGPGDGGRMGAGGAVQQGYERVSVAAHPLMVHKVLPHAAMVVQTPHEMNQVVRNAEMGNAYLSQQRLPEYHSGRDPATAILHPGPALEWNREREQDHGRGWGQPWDQDRPWVQGLNVVQDLPRPFQKPIFQRNYKKGRPSQGRLPGGSLVEKATPIGKKKQTEQGLGLCTLCGIDCITAEILKQHMGGKKHKRKLEKQNIISDGTKQTNGLNQAKKATEVDALDEIAREITMGVGAKKTNKSTAVKGSGVNVGATVAASTNPAKKRPMLENEQGQAARKRGRSAANGSDMTVAGEKTEIKIDSKPEKKVDGKTEKIVSFERCELCNITCTSKAILETHFSGKKHASRLKKLLSKDEIASLLKTDDKKKMSAVNVDEKLKKGE